MDTEGSDEQTLTQKGPFNLVFSLNFLKSVCCCIDVFFLPILLSLLDAEVVSLYLSVPEFSTATFS